MPESLRTLRLAAVLASLGLAALSLAALFLTVRGATAEWDPGRPFDNPVDNWRKRVRDVPDLLPPGVDTVGYAADWDLPGHTYNPVDQDAEYVLTQYLLAPLKVVPGLEQEWIIGNFTAEGFEGWLDDNLRAYEITALKSGIYLIHRLPP